MIFDYSRPVQGCMMFRRNINMSPHTAGTQALLRLAPPHYSSLRTCAYWFALHSIVELYLWWPNREKLLEELLVRFLWLLAASVVDSVWLMSLAISSGLNCPCWFLCGICWVDRAATADLWVESAEWIGLPLLIDVGVFLEDWTADIVTMKIGLAPKEQFLNRSTYPCPENFFSTTSGW